MKKLLSLLLALCMVFTLAACAGNDSQETTGNNDDSQSDVTVLGEGATVFQFVVEDNEGTKTAFEIHTDETTVGAALLALELISGTQESYGLYVKEVNGITADYDVDGAYWAFYENGAYAANGVDSTQIDTAVTYSFVYTPAE